MNFYLSSVTNSRDNNFQLLRFLAATGVLISHSFPLTQGDASLSIGFLGALGFSLGGICVDIFFISSGFLVARSLLNSSSFTGFGLARVLRIYPALIVAVIFCVFGVGLYFTSVSTQEYLSSDITLEFIRHNITLISGVDNKLPGVFLNNPYPQSVNGSLWTLPYEIKMYALLALLFFIAKAFVDRLKIGSIAILFLIFAIVGLFLQCANHFYDVGSAKSLRFFYLFFAGAAYYFWRDKILVSRLYLALCFCVIAVASLDRDVFFFAYTILVPYVVLCLVYCPIKELLIFNRSGDYSYGIYIYAFPIQQSLIAVFPGLSPYEMMVYSFGLTLIPAVLSWHFIESNALKIKLKIKKSNV